MRTVGLVGLMVVLMAGVSVSAQKGVAPKPMPPIQFDHDINIEDDVTGNFLVIDPMTGEYKFHRCKDGLTLTGFGVVKVNGCALSFEDIQSGRRVLASIDECTQQSKAVVQTFALSPRVTDSEAIKETLSDGNMRDSKMTCAPKIQGQP